MGHVTVREVGGVSGSPLSPAEVRHGQTRAASERPTSTCKNQIVSQIGILLLIATMLCIYCVSFI